MGSSVSKYLEENVGHFGNNAKQIIMSDREISNSKNGKIPFNGFIPELTAVAKFEEEYPELSDEFIKIQQEMYVMFAAKHLDYGLNNITLGGDIVNNSDDKKFSLTGLCIRLTDKISRLKNLIVNGKNYVKGEGMEDTFIDIANYGIISLLVGRNKWKK